MPAGGISTFDGNPNASPVVTAGYRPGVADFNGAALTNDPVNPPDPATMPTAPLFNTIDLLLVSACKMIPTALISVVAGASPTVAFWSTAANLIVANPFTVTRNSVGNYSITYAAGTLPTPTAQPEAALNVLLAAHSYSIGAVNVANGVQVTTTQDGALTDLNFTAKFF
jgi:hypothetical protein